MNQLAQDHQNVTCTDSAKLVELLYKYALRDLVAAHEMWSRLDSDPASIEHLVRAQCIIMELQNSLNHRSGGEVAINLSRLYKFIHYRIAEILHDRVPADSMKIKELIEIMDSISRAWNAARCARTKNDAGAETIASLDMSAA